MRFFAGPAADGWIVVVILALLCIASLAWDIVMGDNRPPV